MEIANGVGTPLLIDEATKKRAFGHYVDLSKCIFAEMMVEREGYVFHVAVVSEKLPDLCSHCLTIGYLVALYTKVHQKHKESKSIKQNLKGNSSKRLPLLKIILPRIP